MKDKSFVVLISLLVVVAIIFVLGIVFQDKIFPTAISSVTLSDEVNSDNRVVGSKTTFEATAAAIFAEIKVSYGKPDTKVKAEWFLIGDDGKEQNIAPGATDQTVSGTRPVLFKIVKPTTAPTWKPGTYRLKIFFNDKQSEVKDFTIKSSVTPTVTPTLTPTK